MSADPHDAFREDDGDRFPAPAGAFDVPLQEVVEGYPDARRMLDLDAARVIHRLMAEGARGVTKQTRDEARAVAARLLLEASA